MASSRRKKTIVTEEIPEAEVLTEVSETDADPLDRLSAQFGQSPGVRLKVARLSAQNVPIHCFYSDTADVNEDWIRDNYGGGRYQIRVWVNDEFKDVFTIEIAEPLRRDANQAPVAQAAERGVSPEFSILQQMFETMNHRLDRMDAARTQTTPAERAPTISELAETLKTLQEIASPQKPETNHLKDTIELIVAVKEAFGDGSGGSDWRSDVARAAKEAIPQLAQLVAHRGVNGAAQPQPPQLNQSSEEEQMKILIQAGLNFAKQKARQGADPHEFVSMVLMVADQPQYANFVQIVQDKSLREIAEAYDPSILQSQFLIDWFTEVHDGIRSAFGSENQVEGDSTGGEGYASDTSLDGVTRPEWESEPEDNPTGQKSAS